MPSEYKPPPNISPPPNVLTKLYKPRAYIRDFTVFHPKFIPTEFIVIAIVSTFDLSIGRPLCISETVHCLELAHLSVIFTSLKLRSMTISFRLKLPLLGFFLLL